MMLELSAGMVFWAGAFSGCVFSIVVALAIPFAVVAYQALRSVTEEKRDFEQVE